jgi:hypothetical protein
MALHTLVTKAATTLTALTWTKDVLQTDIANLAQLILDDINPAHPIKPGAWSNNGILFIPNRTGGFVAMQPGDTLAVDLNGWPIIVSAQSLTAGNAWTYV